MREIFKNQFSQFIEVSQKFVKYILEIDPKFRNKTNLS